MHRDLEAPAIGSDMQIEDTAAESFGNGDGAQDLLFSEPMSSVCYWASILLLAVAGAYLIRWQFSHPGSYAAPADDPFGIRTPPWLILSAAPVGVILSLGHAVCRALRGRRQWRMVLTSASLILILACGRYLDAWPW
jgi:hypothetical protein